MISVLGIPLYSRGPKSAVSEFTRICLEEKSRGNCVSATGAHGLVYAKKHPGFRRILLDFYWNLPDGMPTVWVGRMKGANRIQRCYGPDFFAEVMRSTGRMPVAHYLCGGQEGVAEILRENCSHRFGNDNVVGTYCPPFRDMTEQEVALLGQDIESKKADVVWIGLSTPRQEQLAARLAPYVRSRFLVTVGAAFDFHTDRVQQAPKFMQSIGMEWFFRLCKEPRRLSARYFEIVPLFIYFNIAELVSRRSN